MDKIRTVTKDVTSDIPVSKYLGFSMYEIHKYGYI